MASKTGLLKSIRTFIRSLGTKNIILIVAGSLIQAAGICNIHAFSEVTEGGTIGLTILLFRFFHISPAISSLVINVGCYAFGWKVIGKKFLAYSGVSIVSYSIFYAMFEPFAPVWPELTKHPLVCAIVGAIFVGVGVGLSVMGGGAPGGDDALAMSLSEKFKCKIEIIYLVSDLVVLAMCLTYIPLNKIVFSLFSVVLSGQIVGAMQRFQMRKQKEKNVAE